MDIINGVNGARFHEPQTESEADDALDKPICLDYRPQIPAFSLWNRGGSGGSFITSMLWDVPQMMASSTVRNAMSYYCGGIASVKFSVEADSSKIGEFAHANFQRFWQRSLAQSQHVYRFGWLGCEINYRTDQGIRHFDSLHDFYPFDVWAITKNSRYRGISVEGVHRLGLSGGDSLAGIGEQRLLWGPRKWPAKGFWLSHNREYNRFYGMSQLYAAWAPWRRLECRDGAYEIEDGAAYRAGYRGPEGRFPAKGQKKKGDASYDQAREVMREMVEMAKAGFSVALPGTRDEKGEYEWQINWPDHVLDVTPLTQRCEFLQKLIQIAIGVPPELLEASDTGSGYSGRRIPLQGFYTTQLANARNLVHAFQWQICEPLIRWNFGPGHKINIKVELVTPELLEQKQQGPGGEGQAGEQEPQPKPSPKQGSQAPPGMKPKEQGVTLSTAIDGGRYLSMMSGDGVTLGEFVEVEHPRDHGKFAKKEGTSGDIHKRLHDAYDNAFGDNVPKKKKERDDAKKQYYAVRDEWLKHESGKKKVNTDDATADVVSIVKKLGGDHNFAHIVQVRKLLTEAGITSREAQDAAIDKARRAGLATMSALGTGHARSFTEDEKRDAIMEDEMKMGYISLTPEGLKHPATKQEPAKREANPVISQQSAGSSKSQLPTVKPEEHAHTITEIVAEVGKAHKFADITKVREALSKAGIIDRADQDAVILHARKQHLITASGIEGRHGITPEQQRDMIHEGEDRLGYLSVRPEGEKLLRGPTKLSLLSILATEPSDDLASDPAEHILRLILSTVEKASAEQRRAILAALDTDSVTGSFDAARAILTAENQFLIGLLADAQLAATLTAMQAIAARTSEQDIPLEVFTPIPPWLGMEPQGEEEPEGNPLWPVIDAAVADLRGRRLLTREDFDNAVASARTQAFTVANVEQEATLEHIRTLLAEVVEKGGTPRDFKRAVRETDEGALLSDNHLQTIFRNNIGEAYSRGQEKILEHPVLGELFPYRAYDCIHDGRVRPNHAALEHHGIQGTNIYDARDPVWALFRPPWEFGDRCGWRALSVADAADEGIEEAIEAERTGLPPRPHFVAMPPFRPDPRFEREPQTLSTDKGEHGGEFVATGARETQVPEKEPERKPQKDGDSDKSTRADTLHAEADKKADGILAKFKAGMDKVTSLPVLKQLKRLGDFCKQTTAKLYKGLEKRYGRATAIACLASGNLIDASVISVGAIIGVPLVIPGLSIVASLPAVAMAEVYKQLRGSKTLGTVDMDVVERFGLMLSLMDQEEKTEGLAEAMGRLADGMTALMNRPEPVPQAPPSIVVNAPITMPAMPPVNISAPITVQPSPAPEVRVQVPVTVQGPKPGKVKETQTVTRDPQGELSGSVKIVEPLPDEPTPPDR